MSTNVMVVFVVCRKLVALFRVMVKTASGSASDDEAQALVKMRRDYMEHGKLWREQIKIGTLTTWLELWLLLYLLL